MKKDFLKVFESTLKMQRYLKEAETSPLFKELSDLSSKREGQKATEWAGTATMAEADNLLMHGDKTALKRLKKAQATAVARRCGDAYKRSTFCDIVGFAAHVPNYLAGVPQTMVNSQIVKVKNTKVLNFVFSVSMSAQHDAAEISRAGAALLAYVESIEKAGFRVNLYTIATGKKRDTRVAMITKIKDSGCFINVLKVSYPLINASFLRRHFLRFVETAPITERQFLYGYGSPITEEREIMDILKAGKIKFDSLFTVQNMAEKMRMLSKQR